jgi:hypothetical protein
LLDLLSQQNAFGPTYALARYYRSTDKQEPDTLRIRRTVLIHKLGQQRYLEPDASGNPDRTTHSRTSRRSARGVGL